MHGLVIGRLKRDGKFKPRSLLKAVFLVFTIVALAHVQGATVCAQASEKEAQIDLRTAIARAAEKNIPSVVHIEVIHPDEGTNSFQSYETSSSLRFHPQAHTMRDGFNREFNRGGTGIFINNHGDILTTIQVTGGADTFHVWLSDGSQYRAKLLGTDSKTDIAVIRIATDATFPCVIFGDSNEVRVGQWVVAIGYPRGLNHIVTKGIISAMHRKGLKSPNSYKDFLQIDVPINEDNSGAPLLNLSGEVIGVNSAAISKVYGLKGMDLAIPSKLAMDIAEQLVANERVVRGWLGAGMQDITPNMAKSFGMKRDRGVLIDYVVKGGPADSAGIKRGDVLIYYQGLDIPDSATLLKRVASTPVGQKVNAILIRNGKRQNLTVRIGAFQNAGDNQGALIGVHLGVGVRPATSQEVKRYGLHSRQGLVITSLHPDSPLFHNGFEAKDMLLSINGRTLHSVQDLANMVHIIGSEQQMLVLGLDHRSGRSGYVQIALP